MSQGAVVSRASSRILGCEQLQSSLNQSSLAHLLLHLFTIDYFEKLMMSLAEGVGLQLLKATSQIALLHDLTQVF